MKCEKTAALIKSHFKRHRQIDLSPESSPHFISHALCVNTEVAALYRNRVGCQSRVTELLYHRIKP